MAFTLTNLGDAVRALCDPSKAVDLLERALSISERAYGRDHVKTAYTLRNLGHAYYDLGDTDTAHCILQNASLIFECANDKSNARWCRGLSKKPSQRYHRSGHYHREVALPHRSGVAKIRDAQAKMRKWREAERLRVIRAHRRSFACAIQ